jgi:AsmA protein
MGPGQPKIDGMKLLLKILASLAAVVVLALIAVNFLVSPDAVRDRVAARIMEQSGRELKVNGDTSLLFLPNPHIVLTDATITDPDQRAGTADLAITRIELDLSLLELLSRQVDADRVVMVRPVLTVRLQSDGPPPLPPGGGKQRGDAGAALGKQASASSVLRFVAAETGATAPRRDIRLNDVRIEDGTVRILYDEKGTERRIEHIEAALSLPHVTDPLTAKGKLDWKDKPVGFDLKLASPADLRMQRPAALTLSLDTDAIAAKFDGNVSTRPSFAAEGELTAKAHSLPSLLAWMREKPTSAAAIGNGELSSHVAWKSGEITFSQARFALAHATGQGEAVVTLRSPRPHIRAALALEELDLNAFLAAEPEQAAGASAGAEATKPSPPGEASPPSEPSPATGDAAPQSDDGISRPERNETGQAQPETAPAEPPSHAAAVAPPSDTVSSAQPAAFDADVNLNIHQTRVGHLNIGPSSLGLGFRDGVLNATLGRMELYDGEGSGKLTLDASRPVPTFSGDFELDGVAAEPLLSDAAQFGLLSGRAKMELQISGTGATAATIKSSLAGRGNVALSDGAIKGIDITELINSIGAGQIPDMQQGPGAKTVFSALGGSFTIASGVAESNNLQMTSPLLKVTARGTVDMVLGSLDILTQPQIVAGPEGKRGGNDLAGLTIPIRVEGPLAHPSFRPEIKGMFAGPEQTSKTVKQLGDVIQKKFKGKPVGEAIGRFLGSVRIGPGGREAAGAEPPPDSGNTDSGKTDSGKTDSGKVDRGNARKPPPPEGNADPESGEAPQGDSAEPDDPDVDRILR